MACGHRRRWRRRRAALLRHREEVACLAVERHRAGAIHGLQVLLHLETRRALLLDDGHRAIAMRAERLHRRGIEHRAVGTAGERQARENFAVLGAQNHHHRLRGLRRRIARSAARREEHLILRVQRESVTSALVDERIVRQSPSSS